MFPLQEFLAYQVEHDHFNDTFPVLKLDDLPLKDESLPIELSYCIGFTNFRRTQLARSLETLCRQDWKNFEVLICDDGSTQDMESVYSLFRPLLRMRTIRLEREGFSGCPSKALTALYPFVQGSVIAISQPEMMLKKWACEFLYKAHFQSYPNAHYYKIRDPSTLYIRSKDEFLVGSEITKEEYNLNPRWACLKPGWLNAQQQKVLDMLDWHTNVATLETLPGYWTAAPGLSAKSNEYWGSVKPFPWWFIGSALATDKIWEDMPITVGHGTIDMWMYNYRHVFNYVDVIPVEVGAYHQDHVRGSVSPIGEQDTVSIDSIRRAYEQKSLHPES